MQEETTWQLKPTKIYAGTFETSLNGPGFSITLCNLTFAAYNSGTSVDELMELLGANVKAPSWPNVHSNTSTRVARKQILDIDVDKNTDILDQEDIKGNSSP
jgi:dihydroxyacetone kinase